MTVFNKTQKQIITIFLKKKLLKASVFSIKKEAELEPGSPFQIFKTLFSSVVRAVQGCLLLFSILGKKTKGRSYKNSSEKRSDHQTGRPAGK